MKDVRILGVDLGKNSCSIVGLDGAGRVLLRRRTRREGVIALAAKLPGCVVAMEACCGAHHLGRLRVGTRVQRLLDDMLDQWRALDARIKALDDEFAEMARNDPAARRLATIPGIGVLNATALVAAIGDGRTFSRGRDLSAWLGLVPHQATTGGRPKLLGITKRGSRYLRKLVIQGARAALPSLARTATPLGGWLRGLLARAHGNTVVVALASKLIRIAWALLRNETRFVAGGAAVA